MGELEVGRAPDVLTTFGLGSCLGLAIYDRQARVGGLAHIMLPDSRIAKVPARSPGKFADTAIPELLRRLSKAGADAARCKARLVGAASMFAAAFDPMRLVGPRNVEAAKALLASSGIGIEASEVGGTVGRTVTLFTESGQLVVRTVAEGSREI